jgi:hypothetical protein
MLPSEFDVGFICNRRLQHWIKQNIFETIWARLLEGNDAKRDIRWIWQSLGSVSI